MKLYEVTFRLGMVALALLGSNAFGASPAGINAAGQLELAKELASAKPDAFAFTQLESGVQIRVGGTVKNVLFYGPEIVRVNANLGQPYTKQPSLTVILQPTAIPFAVKDGGNHLELSTASLSVLVDKKSGALTFQRLDGALLARENAGQPSEIKEVRISDAPTYEVKQNFTLTDDESLYGLGQYNQRYMDYRGKEVLLVQTNIGMVVPLLIWV